MAGNTLKEMATNFVKLERFDGGNFRRWQKKMHFLLTTLKVAHVLTTPQPQESETETVQEVRGRAKWENDNFICLGHILNGMADSLFDTYQATPTAKELWDILENRYMKEDATSKKFLVSQFNNYVMKDNRPVMEQLYEIERILGHFKQHEMKMDDSIIVCSIIDKLPPSWKEFKHTLKHKKEDLSLEELANHLRIEQEFRKQEEEKETYVSSANVVEDKPNNKRKGHPTKHGHNNAKKKKALCWECGSPDHLKRDCPNPKESKGPSNPRGGGQGSSKDGETFTA